VTVPPTEEPGAAVLARLKLLYPNFKLVQTGVSSTIFALSHVLAGMGVDVSVVGKQPPEPLPVRRRSDASAITVWHARRNIEMLAGLILRRVRPRTRLIFTSAAQRVHSAYTKRLIAKMDRVVATSAASAGFLDRDCVIVPHGIDTGHFAPADRAALKRRLGLDPGAQYLGSFGALRAAKGTDLFVDALIATLGQHPGWKAIVVGHVVPRERAYVDELKSRVSTAGLADRIAFTGHVPDARDYLRAMEICVAPSRKEGFGLTALEAMAAEVPVVASRAGSYNETIVDGETGLIAETGNAGALAGAIARLMDDDALRQQMGRRGRQRVLARYAIEREAAALLQVYIDLIS
jgi:mannosyltransferase